MKKPITVLIVDDSALIREMFSEMLSSAPDIQVLGTAADPFEAREKIKQLNPDVLTLDIEMPKMDGLSFLEKIMTLRPMPVVMVSSLTQKGAEATIRALELGAFDYVSKPVTNQNRDTIGVLKQELISKVQAAALAHIRAQIKSSATGHAVKILPFSPPPHPNRRLIAIGSSTGGVEALREIFLQLPANAPPIVITQHMPATFTTSFAARLNMLSQVNVAEARHHERLKPGHAYLAPGGESHLAITKIAGDYVCRIEPGETVTGHRPSVDVLFHSVAEAAGAHAIGVILTGMGRDGAAGLKAMRERGAYTIGQDKASCVVYGMPQAAMHAGASTVELPLSKIAHIALHLCEQ
ncbi:MAG: chemotaxis response regulator protein-glutamate methylesterase [Rickettsiales bacterium]